MLKISGPKCWYTDRLKRQLYSPRLRVVWRECTGTVEQCWWHFHDRRLSHAIRYSEADNSGWVTPDRSQVRGSVTRWLRRIQCRELVSADMPFMCKLWRPSVLQITDNLCKVFGQWIVQLSEISVAGLRKCPLVKHVSVFSPINARCDNQLTQHIRTFTHQSSPLHRTQFSNVPFRWTCERSHRRLTNLATCSDESNNSLLRTFPTVRRINSFRRRPSPWQINHTVATKRCSTSIRSNSHGVPQSVTRQSVSLVVGVGAPSVRC